MLTVTLAGHHITMPQHHWYSSDDSGPQNATFLEIVPSMTRSTPGWSLVRNDRKDDDQHPPRPPPPLLLLLLLLTTTTTTTTTPAAASAAA